jgi:D-glycero-D-manno-heptose 1,7-bisphosphate phosphatase
MLQTASADLHIDLQHSFMVGDRWRDIEAGQRAGCTAFFVDYDYDEPRPRPPYVAISSLAESAHWILSNVTPCSSSDGLIGV